MLKGSYDVAKKNIILCIWGNSMFKIKKNIIFHILYIVIDPLCSAFLKRLNFDKAHCSEKLGVLWLVSYPVHCDWPNTIKHVTEMLRHLPHCDAVSWRDKTKTIKLIINEAFVASSRDIVVDYNDFYSRCITPHKHYHVCICERRSDKQALHYTAHNSHLNNQGQIL